MVPKIDYKHIFLKPTPNGLQKHWYLEQSITAMDTVRRPNHQ